MKLSVSICIRCGYGRVENRDTLLCATCSHEDRKAERTQAKVVKPIKKVSDKRNIQNQEYARLRDEYLEAYPACEVVECSRKSSEIHHMAGREGEKLTDVNHFLAVCRLCHERITVDSAWAISQGYSILRSKPTI